MKALTTLLIFLGCVTAAHAVVTVRFSCDAEQVINQPSLKLAFSINEAGVVTLDASTRNRSPQAVEAVDAWDSDQVGVVEDPALYGKQFVLTAYAENESGNGFPPIALWSDDGGVLGVGGHNSRRIDGQLVNAPRNLEKLVWILEGDVVLNLVNFGCGSGTGNGGIIMEGPDNEMRTGPMRKNTAANWNIPLGYVKVANRQQLIFKADPSLANGAGLAGMVFVVSAPE